jgi:hypothetical protein
MKYLLLVLFTLPTYAAPIVRRGDVNADGNVNITDAIYLGNYLWSGGPPPPCFQAADVDGDGGLDIVDVYLIYAHLFDGLPIPFELVECF